MYVVMRNILRNILVRELVIVMVTIRWNPVRMAIRLALPVYIMNAFPPPGCDFYPRVTWNKNAYAYIYIYIYNIYKE